MITNRRLTAFAASFMLAAFVLATAPAALAQRPDPPDGTGDYPPPQLPTQVIHDGTPLWVFALVAALAICVAVAAILSFQALQRSHVASAASIKHA